MLLLEAEVDLLDAIDDACDLMEATGEYYYEETTVKRWSLGDGGRSGNCEICVDNSDLGWIDQDAIFEGVFEDVDEPPAHPHCTCTLETKDSRKRVYA